MVTDFLVSPGVPLGGELYLHVSPPGLNFGDGVRLFLRLIFVFIAAQVQAQVVQSLTDRQVLLPPVRHTKNHQNQLVLPCSWSKMAATPKVCICGFYRGGSVWCGSSWEFWCAGEELLQKENLNILTEVCLSPAALNGSCQELLRSGRLSATTTQTFPWPSVRRTDSGANLQEIFS